MKPAGYSRLQISLHWIIMLLVALQFIFHDSISEAWDKIEGGLEAAFNPMVAMHVFGGILILLLTLWRLAVRRKRGAPALPETESAVQRIAAHATHHTLYLLLILTPISGAVAWFGGVEKAADGHEVLKTLMLILVALHVLAALFHQFVLKNNLLDRMRTEDKG